MSTNGPEFDLEGSVRRMCMDYAQQIGGIKGVLVEQFDSNILKGSDYLKGILWGSSYDVVDGRFELLDSYFEPYLGWIRNRSGQVVGNTHFSWN